MKIRLRFFIVILILMPLALLAQQKTGSISGSLIDKKDRSELIGVTILVKGTSIGTVSDAFGKFVLRNLKAGEYDIEISYIGYQKILKTDIVVKAGENTALETFEMRAASTNIDEVVVIGKKPLIDIEKAQSVNTISRENIELAPSRQIQGLINTQPGVIQSPAGVNIRGGRTYETGMYIDGVSVTDPLAGTGFGMDIGSNAMAEIEIITGGIGADVGDATAGVIRTKTRRGGDKTDFGFTYKRDNFGFNKDYSSSWNYQVFEFNVGGPLLKKWTHSKLKYSLAANTKFSDEYYKNPAKQEISSLYPQAGWGNNHFFTPFQDNRWSATFNITYDFKNNKKLMFQLMRSITVNQDVNMLRIFGNDAPFTPGYQFPFSQQMDNANTFTSDAYMQMLNFKHQVSKRFSYDATGSRLFVQLRGDANGRPWRTTNVDQIFDAASINTFPISLFPPTNTDSVVFVNLPNGFYNNNGIASLWHHHYVEEWVLKAQGNIVSRNSLNKFTFGFESKLRNMLWIDIVRPWIGAPIQLADGTMSQTFRLGQQSDIWKVTDQRGGFYVSDQIKYHGLIASVGGRFEYWAPGQFIEDAIANPVAPIRNEIRADFLQSSFQIGSLHYKFRFLPKINASFPIADNKMLFFNYGHTTILPHPSYLYPGLNPYYQDRSTFANVGNPNLNPEVDISYEIGLRTQLTHNDAFTISAFWKDKYDFITTTSMLIKDVTGREISRTIRINSDYARTRGLEVGYIKRIGNWYNGQLSFTYMVSTGQSASANEKLKDILASGNNEDTKEYYLPWDKPFDFKTNHVFRLERKNGMFGWNWLNHFSVYVETVWRSGVRYTPYIYDHTDAQTKRPIYVVNPNPDARWSKIGSDLFWTDISLSRTIRWKKNIMIINVQITNAFNNLNASIINPVTGRAYAYGDNVPDTWTDPRYQDPRLGNSGPAPLNPARYMEQRHIVLGFTFKL